MKQIQIYASFNIKSRQSISVWNVAVENLNYHVRYFWLEICIDSKDNLTRSQKNIFSLYFLHGSLSRWQQINEWKILDTYTVTWSHIQLGSTVMASRYLLS
jgi:hypothetical protein